MLGEVDIKEIVSVIGGELLQFSQKENFPSGASLDTRSLVPGDIFFALKGNSSDGHFFLKEAIRKGASALVVSDSSFSSQSDVSVAVVNSPLLALQELGAWNRKKWKGQLLAVTGSFGKTSTKNMLYSVLRQRYSVCASVQSYNNHIGVPLTLLALRKNDDFCIAELGTNSSGEISFLCDLCAPHFGILTGLGKSHIELLGSQKKIAEEKANLSKILPENGAFFLHENTPFFDVFSSNASCKIVKSHGERNQISLKNVEIHLRFSQFTLMISEEEERVCLPISGEHMLQNALLASCVGNYFDLETKEIAQGLSSVIFEKSRMEIKRSKSGFLICNDSYNASPESVEAAIYFLSDVPLSKDSQRWLVFSEMRELGKYARDEHFRLGNFCAQRGVHLAIWGEDFSQIFYTAFRNATASKSLSSGFFRTREEMLNWLSRRITSKDFVLCKGSHSLEMDSVVKDISNF